MATRVQVPQVLLNLILNGIEAMTHIEADDRVLCVATRLADHQTVVVAVSDSGPDRLLENASRIFDAFFTTKPGGVGMGLSIRRSIGETRGGRTSVCPKPPRGCTFSLRLPALAG